MPGCKDRTIGQLSKAVALEEEEEGDAVTGAANASAAQRCAATNAVKELRRRGHCHLQLAVNNTLSLVQLLFSAFSPAVCCVLELTVD